jgi:uncharacterized protein with HEPN domain
VTRDLVYLNHILDAAVRVEEYASVGHDQFFANSHWQDAMIRQLEIIGEASKRISVETRDWYPDISWRRIAGLRDVLIHASFKVDLAAVWEISQRDVPFLRRRVQEIIQGLGSGK